MEIGRTAMPCSGVRGEGRNVPRIGVKGRGRAKAVSPHTALYQSPIALATGARLLGGDGGYRADVGPVIAHGVVAGCFKKRAADVR